MVPYTVYMDESFYEFWGLQNPEGNFCYAVFGLPDQHLRTLDQFHAEFLRDFQTAVKADFTSPGNLTGRSSRPMTRWRWMRILPFHTR